MKIFKRIYDKLKITWSLLFFAMKGADNVIFGHTESNGESVFERHDSAGGVFQDLLEEKVTQEVEELRDKNYRVLRESDLYDTSDIDLQMDEHGNITEFKNAKRLRKKTKYDFQQHIPVFDGDNAVIIQDNRKFDSETENHTAIYDFETLLDVTRDGITPRFEIEKFVTKIVVRNGNDDKSMFVDLYVPSEASQFGKIDAMLIANIYRMWESKDYRSDIVDFTGFEFVSYKAWGTEDLFQYRFNNPKLIDIKVFDGSFVLVFDCTVGVFGKYIPEKFKTESLDKKYKEKAPKGDIFEIDVNNFKKKPFLK
jgi:hypothetical protein